jgi:hypothetical protein
MIAATAIQFTSEQARAFAGVTPESWRHWRNAIPYLNAKRGKAARFSISEIVALSILSQTVCALGVGVGRTAAAWDQLFQLCAAERPSRLRDLVAVVSATSASLQREDSLQLDDGACLATVCAKIVDRLASAALADSAFDEQPPLPFAPRIVGGRRDE